MSKEKSFVSKLNPMNWLRSMMYSCDQLSHLKMFEAEQTPVVKFRMKLHVWICNACKAYCSQLELIDESYKNCMKKIDDKIDHKKVDELSERIIAENTKSES